MQQDRSVKDLPEPAAQHHPWDTCQTGMWESFPSLAVVFQIICFDCVHMLSIHQHLYAVSYNSHLLVFNERLFTGAFFQGVCVVCRASPHPSSLQHNLRWGIELRNKSRIYYVTHTACGVRQRGTLWMGVLQESPSSRADWILLVNAVEKSQGESWPRWNSLKIQIQSQSLPH